MRLLNSAFMLILILLNYGCNNPSGSSVVSSNHTPLLKEPGPFRFSSIRFTNTSLSIGWTASSRTSGYKVFYGTSQTAMTTEATSCAGTTRRCTVSGLNPTATYYFIVKSTNATGTVTSDPVGSAKSVESFDITSSSSGDGSIGLSWSSAPGATSYDIVYGTAPGSYTSVIKNVTSPYDIVTGLNNGVTYYLRVVAYNAQGGYAVSTSEATEKPMGVPLAPYYISISTSPGMMSVSWSDVPGATSYKIFRGTNSGDLTLVGSDLTGTTYNDNSIVDGTTYYYAVKAYNGLDSPLSTEASAKSISIFAASSATPGPLAAQATLSWPAVTGADSYDIKYGTNPTNLNQTATNVTSPYTVSGLTATSLYYFKVVAKNAVGGGATLESSNQLSALPVPPISPPSSVVASATPGSVTLNWSAVSGASSYTIMRGTSSGSYSTLETGVVGTSYTDTSAVNGTTYFYAVKSFNGLFSINSSEVSVRPVAAPVISALSPVSSTSLSVSWSPVVGADSYDILYGTSSGVYSSSAVGVTSPYTLTGLQNSRIYYVVVRAQNTTGSGSFTLSTQSSAQTKTAAPTSLTASATPTQVSLDWGTVTGAITYTVYRGTSTGNYSQLATNLSSSDYTDTTTTPGTTYYYAVSATNTTESANSSEIAVKPVDQFAISSHSAPTTTTIQLTWPAAAGADTYDVKYGTSIGNYTTTLTNKTSPFTITGLTSGVTYYFVVVGKNAVGSGSSYTTAEEIDVTPRGPPTGVAAVAVNNHINLTWSAVTGSASYKVYRGTSTGVYSLLQDNVTGTSFSDTTAVAGTTYYYVLRSFNGTESANSSEVTAKTIANFSIASVTPLSSTTLQVTFPATAGGDLYDVRYGTTTGNYTTTLSAVTSPYTITGLAANTNYFVVVRARNTVGPGANRSTAEEVMKTLITTPSSLVASASPGQVGLNWSATAGATYKVFRGTATGTYSEIATGLTSNAYLDTTVVDGTTYFYAIKANNGNDSAFSNEVSVQSIESFAFSSATAASATSATLTWTAATGAASYDVRYGTSPGVYLSTVTNVTSPYTLTGLTANTTYYLVIRAKNAVGSGTNLDSLERNFKTATAANASLAAAAVTGQINLTWSATTGAASYNIYRGTSSGVYSQIASGVTATSYADTTVVNGTTYFYVIRSFNGVESANSNEVSAQSIAAFTIASTSSPSSTSISVTWSATDGATAYDVRYGTASGVYTTVSNVTSPYTITGRTAGTIHYIVVRARNTIGAGSSAQTPEVTQITALGAPASLASTATPGNVNLTWGAVSGASSYKIFRGTATGVYTEIGNGITTASYTDTTIVNGTQYYYVVKAFNGADSANSNETTIRPIESFALTSLTAASPTSIQVTWPAVSGASSYDIKYGTSTGSYSTTLTSQVSPKTITGLTVGTTYFVIVVAKNAIGSGTSVNSTESSVLTAFGAPAGLAASATPGSVALSWGAVAGATSYKVGRSTSSGGPYTDIATGVATSSYADSTASDGTVYYYAVKASNGADSPYSSEVSIKPISTFTFTSATPASATTLDLVWTSATGADAYDVRYGTTSGVYSSTAANVTSPYTLTGLTAGTTYYIVVRAKNAVGAGTNLDSSPLSAKTATAAPASLVATATTGQIALSWAAVTGATNYNVYRGTATGVYTQLASAVATNSYTDSTVANGTQYFYVVRANNGVESANSSEATALPMASFSIASIAAASTTSITLSWSGPTGSSTFDVRYGTATGSYSTTLSNVTSPYTITGLTSGTTYFVVVRANNAIGSGSSVQSTQSSQVTPIGAPTGLAASATPGSVNLSWSAVSGASSYKIYRGTTSGVLSLLASGVTGTSYTDSTAANGTTYFYAMSSFNGADSVNSSEVSIKPISTFTFTSVTPASATTLDLVWTSATGADTYDVRYGTTSGVYTSTAANVTSPYTLTGLTAGTTYYIVVRAKNAVGAGTNLDSSVLSERTSPAAPASLAATATTGQVALTWSAAASATSYNVYRGTATGVYTQLATNVLVTNYTDTSVANGSQYFYVVRANNGTESSNSNEATALPMASFSIASIAAASTTSITLSWTGPTGAATFDVRYGTSSGSYTTTLSNVTSPYTITGLASNTTYFVVVRANNTIGSGSSVQSTQSSQITPIGATTGLEATNPLTGGVGLTWTSVSGATSYRVYRGTATGVYSLLASGVTSAAYSDTTAADGTSYFYVVTSFNGAESVYSSEVSKRPISSFSLTAATAASASTINLTWGAATGAASYDVRYGTSSGVYLTTVTNVTSPYTLTGLTAGTTYFISIQAKNAVGTGSTVNSNELNAKTAVGGPAGLAAISTPATIDLSWSAVSGATSYNVYRSTTTGGPYSQVASAITLTSYTDTPVDNGTTYFYVIRAFNGIESANSSEVSTRPIGNFSLTAATPVSSTSVSLTWGAATGASTYDIRYGTSPGTYTSTVLSQTSPATVTGLAAGTRYYFAIRANNAIGAGTTNLSSELSALTATAAPTSLTATATTGQVDLTWTNPTGGSSYNVYRSTTSGGPYSSIATAVATTNYTDSSVVAGTTYFYVVRSNNGIESVNSNEATAATVGTFSISAINVISSTSLQIVWGVAAGASAYDVYYRTSPTGAYTTVSNVTSPYSLTTVANTTYYVKIRARSTVGSGSWTESGEVSQVTPVVAPTGLTATGGTASVTLNWVAASGATSYKILRGTATGVYGQIASGITGTTYTDSTAVNGTTYFYVVRSFNGSDSANSSEVSRQPIATPSITSITTTSTTSITVTWPAATGAATYDINYGTATGTYTATVSGATSPATITGLTSGVTYFVRLVAKNAVGGGAGTSVNSTESSGAPNSAPDVSALGDQTMQSDSSLAVPFTLSDSNNVLNCQTSMSGSSSDTTLLPNSGIVFTGTMPNCEVTLTPALGQSGSTSVTITATDGITPVSQTFTLTVSSCEVTSITWQTQPPATTAAGTAMSSFSVQLKKADGSLCTGNTAPVTIDIATDGSTQGDATVFSGATVTPVNGIATFPAAVIQRAGTGHTLIATQGAVSSPESNTFNITALTASKIAFFQQPLTSRPGLTMSPAPVVKLTDTYGNFLSSGTGTVTLTLKTTTTTAGESTCTSTNATGVTLTGGSASMGNGGGSGTATFNSLSVSAAETYCLSATHSVFATPVNSDPFTVLTLSLEKTVSVIEMLQGPAVSTSTTNNFYRRGSIVFRASGYDGTNSFYLQVVATNASSSNAFVRIQAGNKTMGTITVPANTTIPSLFTLRLTSNIPTGNSLLRLYLIAGANGSALTVSSAKLISVQTNSTKSRIYIPLSSTPSSNYVAATTGSITTTSTTHQSSVFLPSYTFNASKFSRIDSTEFYLVGINVCVGLFNKDTNTQIGTDLCTTSTSEAILPVNATLPSTNIPPAALNALTSDTNIEVRFKKHTGTNTAVVFKTGLLLNMVGLYNMKTIQRAVPYTTSLATNTNFNTNRVTSFDSSTYFDLNTVNGYVNCRLGAAASGSGSLTLKDYGTVNFASTAAISTTTPVSTVTASTINMSTQVQYTAANAGPLATTGGNHLFVNYAHTSGSFNIQHCLYEEEIEY